MLRFNLRYDTSAGQRVWNGVRNLVRLKSARAEKIVAEQIMKDTDKYLPARTGSLMQRTHIEGSNQIVYPGPYARFLYYGKVMIYEPTGSTFAPKGEHKIVTDRDLVMHQTMHRLATSHWFEVSKAQNQEKWERVAERAIKHGRRSN